MIPLEQVGKSFVASFMALVVGWPSVPFCDLSLCHTKLCLQLIWCFSYMSLSSWLSHLTPVWPCFGLSVCVPPEFICGEACGRPLGHEGEALMLRLVPLSEEIGELDLSLSYEDTSRRQLFVNQEANPYQTLDLPTTDLGLSTPQNCKEKNVYQLPSQWHFVIGAQTDQDRSQIYSLHLQWSYFQIRSHSQLLIVGFSFIKGTQLNIRWQYLTQNQGGKPA